jgi:signal transduction histidine kinase
MKVPLDVLIVEDSETDTKLAVRELRRSGFTPNWERVDSPEALRAALQQFHLDLEDVGALAKGVEAAGFRIAQEALTNVARHAKAGKVRIRLRRSRSWVLVHDDGQGFDVEAARKRAESGASLGLAGMEERASLANGQLEIESTAGRGTSVRVRFRVRARRTP